ncbi:alpha/beta hydrolase family protein [Undibacterium sp. Di24W]|uniref:alpha/beta hydrolase family protein n=1 Tax=Undibacterium sp. Di24W TaxID=3413033 RepID=UPI003BF33F5E
MNQNQATVNAVDPTRTQASLGKKVLKWTGVLTIVVLVLGGILIATLFWTALRTEQPVGFQVVRAVDAAGKPFALGIWYPTSAQPSAKWAGNFLMYVADNGSVKGNNLPLVVMSHGTGGSITSHADLALALASAGNVVAAPMHLDNFQDMSSVGTPAYISGRTRQLRSTIDHMLTKWKDAKQIDAERIGAFGFSIGGFTVLTATGAKPNLESIAQYCANSREFACDMLRQSNSFLLKAELPAGSDNFEQDTRIKAIVVAAPGLGFSFSGSNALTTISTPVQLWQGDKDESVPYATNAKVIQDGLGTKVDFQLVPNAGHYSFLTPCGPLKMPPICSDPAQFDRAVFHKTMNKRVIAFFAEHMKK